MTGAGASAAAVIRGAFARLDTHQRWAPGSPAALVMRDSGWLERYFPLPAGPTFGESGKGALWVRWIEGAWYVCHSSVPEWSASRSIPAWVVSRIEAQAFREGSVLSTEALGAMSAIGSERAVRSWPTGAPAAASSSTSPGLAPPAAWTAGVPRLIAMLVDAALMPADSLPGSFAVPAACLGSGGWIALQAVLAAMLDAGVPEPCAVYMCDPAWTPRPASRVPVGTYVFLHSITEPPAAPKAMPKSRGVDLDRFITDLASARAAICQAAGAASSGSGAPSCFVDAVAGAVPLALVDAGLVRRDEAIDWSALVAERLPGAEPVRRQVGELARRARDGEDAVVGPAVALAARWLTRAGVSADARKQLDSWIWPMLGSA